MRICSDCGTTFEPAVVRSNRCRPCYNAYYRRLYAERPKRRQVRKAPRNPEVTARWQAAYNAKNRAQKAAYRKRTRATPEGLLHMRAQAVAQRARRAGRLIQQPCEYCQSPNTHAHHEDYAQPLVVRWLCASHHQMRHAEIRGNALVRG